MKNGAVDISIKKLNPEGRVPLKAALETFPKLGSNAEAWHASAARRKELTDD